MFKKSLFYIVVLCVLCLSATHVKDTPQVHTQGSYLSSQEWTSDLDSDPMFTESARLLIMLSRIKNGIVYCYSNNSKTTGFFISNDGWILTAGHKVDQDFPQANQIHVKLARNGKAGVYTSVRIINPPLGWDLLLFKIDYKPKYHFTKFKEPYRFEENWIVGFRGVADISVSSNGFATTNTAYPRMYYTTATSVYGNSGSPVVNRFGEVLGVAVMRHKDGDTLFVPAVIVKQYIQEAMKQVKE